MRRFRFVVDIITGLAGMIIVLLLFTPYGYMITATFLNVVAIIGLLRLNLLNSGAKEKNKLLKFHLIGLATTIVSLVLIYLNIPFGEVLILPGVAMVAAYHLAELLINAHKNYINTLHILIYLVGLVYIIQVKYQWNIGISSLTTIAILNSLIFCTLILVGFRGLLSNERLIILSDETPIDFPDTDHQRRNDAE